jgi:hypothetical protein
LIDRCLKKDPVYRANNCVDLAKTPAIRNLICQLRARIWVHELDFESSYEECLNQASEKQREDNMRSARRGYDEHKGEEALCDMMVSSSFAFPTRNFENLKLIGLGSNMKNLNF